MSISINQIEQIIREGLPGCTVEVESPDLVHFNAVVTAPQFVGLSLIKQQQMVYALFKEKIAAGEIHALSLKTLTPK